MDDQKNNVLIAVLVFNIVVMAYIGIVGHDWLFGTGETPFSYWNWPLAFLLGGITAGITFFVMSKKK